MDSVLDEEGSTFIELHLHENILVNDFDMVARNQVGTKHSRQGGAHTKQTYLLVHTWLAFVSTVAAQEEARENCSSSLS